MLSNKEQRIKEGEFAYKGLEDTFSCNSVHNLTAGCIMDTAMTILHILGAEVPDLLAPPSDEDRQNWTYKMLQVCTQGVKIK